jgi:hypothetical protein
VAANFDLWPDRSHCAGDLAQFQINDTMSDTSVVVDLDFNLNPVGDNSWSTCSGDENVIGVSWNVDLGRHCKSSKHEQPFGHPDCRLKYKHGRGSIRLILKSERRRRRRRFAFEGKWPNQLDFVSKVVRTNKNEKESICQGRLPEHL